jgi:hypothetical protein
MLLVGVTATAPHSAWLAGSHDAHGRPEGDVIFNGVNPLAAFVWPR